jgi:hypothetical protein
VPYARGRSGVGVTHRAALAIAQREKNGTWGTYHEIPGTAALNSCELARKELKPGTYHLVARYPGAISDDVSASARLTLTVTPRTLRVRLPPRRPGTPNLNSVI